MSIREIKTDSVTYTFLMACDFCFWALNLKNQKKTFKGML
jgi:hypothetical protein